MFTVGPSRTCAPFAMASWPIRWPACWRSGALKVAPRAVPQGKQAEGTPLKKRVPRTPLGPSERRIEGMLSRGMGFVCQKSIPWTVSE